MVDILLLILGMHFAELQIRDNRVCLCPSKRFIRENLRFVVCHSGYTSPCTTYLLLVLDKQIYSSYVSQGEDVREIIINRIKAQPPAEN